MKISIVIPIYNEALGIEKLLDYLIDAVENPKNIAEILVVDGGSADNSATIIENYGPMEIPVRLIRSGKGRAKQLNSGAHAAKSEILYFLHADSYPPIGYDSFILDEVYKGNEAGCFRMKFDSSHWWLRFLGWLTRFRSKKCRGGDQSQFISTKLFHKIGGYDESYIVYEDNDLVERLFDIGQFVIIPKNVTTSARRYREIGVWKLQYHFFNIHIRKWFGASSEDLYNYYKEKVAN